MKKSKRVSRQTAKKSAQDPMKSPIIQTGIVFFLVTAAALLIYVVKFYTP
ncbi:hypothetical protein M1271_02985 [Patescibacteria group bacterium]|nr:hypothetical protein [Patescibacteria group bacterium]MCL5798141.1 hypothetical protein [Patescibacteria group bacterium]